MSPLGTYLRDQLHRRDLSPEAFGRRSGLGTSHVYQIIRGQKPNVRASTLDRVARGLDMTTAELMAAVAATEARGEDPIETEIRTRTAEMRDAVRGIPREFWGTVIRATFDRAIEGARDMAELLSQASEPPVSSPGEGGVSAADQKLKRDRHDQEPPLAHRKPAPQLLPAGV